MISPPSSPGFAASYHSENEKLPLSPKTRLAQHKQDHLSQLGANCYHVHPNAQPSRRARLDPLSALGPENRSSPDSLSADSASYHSLVTPSSLADLRVSRPEGLLSSNSCGMRRSLTSHSPVYSWPPPVPTPGIPRSSHSSRHEPLHSSDEKSTRGTFLESPTWHPPYSSQTEPTTTMASQILTTKWRAENVLQSTRSRSNSMPTVPRPSGKLWQLAFEPTKAVDEPVGIAHSSGYPTPPGLPPRLSELLPHAHGSVSLSLAPGSQPLEFLEHTRAMLPIGAERSRVVSVTSARIRSSLVGETNDPYNSPSPRPDSEWKNEGYLMSSGSSEKVQTDASYGSVSKEDLERLLRHAVRNTHAPKIISPLSPLRTITPTFDLSADPAFRLRMPSPSTNLSPRYSKCPSRRARTVCDCHQSLNWDTTCMHCQECQRDTVGKRLLAFRFRQHQIQPVQYSKIHAYPTRGGTTSVADDDHIVLANRIRGVFGYEMDEEEKSLWEEVAAATGERPIPFSRVGTPCAAAAHWGSDDGARDSYLDMAEEGLVANDSSLFRDVSVY